MSYVNRQDFIDRLGEEKVVALTDRDNAGEIDDARLMAAAQGASDTFDSYVFPRYQPPISVTGKVKQVVLDLAIYELASDLLETDEGQYKIYLDRMKAALKFLADVQAEKAALVAAPAPPVADSTVNMPTLFATVKARRCV
jgi:phage gp36-like protein